MSDEKIRTLSHSFDWRADHLEWPVTTEVGPGFAGVIAAETRVVWLDPSSGTLAYRGLPIEALAHDRSFEEIAHLLITGEGLDDDPDRFEGFRESLRASRWLPPDVVALIRDMDPATHPTRLLRAGVSALGCHELSVDDDLAGIRHWRELRIVGQVAALIGEIIRHRRGAPPGEPEDDRSLAACVLTALTGRDPLPDEERALDMLWVLYAAHGIDAPTFTSVVVASCLADPYYTVVAGLSALRGSRQGGASEQAMIQLLSLDGPTEAELWVRRTVADGGLIAGFGHPDYRMPDPRVPILRKTAAALARRQGRSELYEVARAVEEVATRELTPRGVHININFYGALLFHLLGAEPPLAPCLIAAARVAGMVAQVREALDEIRLYRPLSRYVGAAERRVPEGVEK